MKLVSALALALALAPAAANAQTTTLTGKIVDLATYVTNDHNMDAMHASMSGHDATGHDGMAADAHGAMKSADAMSSGDGMHAAACPAMLGLVTAGGHSYPLATQQGSATAAQLCKKLHGTATVAGKTYSQGGTTVFLVSTVK